MLPPSDHSLYAMRQFWALLTALTLIVALRPILYAANCGATYTPGCTKNSVGNVQIIATVVGTKPLVTSFNPTAAVTTATTPITITGDNFTGATLVTLDDPKSTVLTGTLTVIGGSTSITGLSIPAGVSAGNYNILVTTPSGTNITSTSKFTVTLPAPTGSPKISSITPNPVITETSSATQITLTAADTAHTSATLALSSHGGTWNSAAGTVTLSGTTHTGTITRTFTAGAADGVFSNTFGISNAGGSDSASVLFYIQPGGW